MKLLPTAVSPPQIEISFPNFGKKAVSRETLLTLRKKQADFAGRRLSENLKCPLGGQLMDLALRDDLRHEVNAL